MMHSSTLCAAVVLLGLVGQVFSEGELVSVGDRVADLLQGSAPVDGSEITDWCQSDADCQRLGDTGATCQDIGGQKQCVCTTPYIGELCYEDPGNIYDAVDILGIFVITFPDADCSQFKSINNAIASFDDMFSQMYADIQTYYLCGSVSMLVQATVNVRNITSTVSLMLQNVNNLASNESFSTALGYSGSTSSLQVSFHPDPGAIPTCIVLNAKKTIIVEGVCRALVCNPGYVPYDEFVNGKVVPSCELDTQGDDVTLTDSAIAGIIFGVLLLAAMIGFIIWHFARADPEDGIPVNDPYNEAPPDNTSNPANEPYGKKDDVDDSVNDDIAV
eukprot:TRINITY_DN2713_c5_g1_i1.p1 TRINITY_DN2713_c5_g1~~TRINITY_DN2713_c5_g1_i1.p1  ORF type:complete len:331 (+),score=72.13 TRINITY_DN2713_c5_g1_i1:145-1137(+)